MKTFYERLNSANAAYLRLEDARCHQHIGAVLVFDAAPLRTAAGTTDIDRIRKAIATRLYLAPRFRQRLAYIPVEQVPVWVDDDGFRIDYHVRDAALPKPGDENALQAMVGQIMSHQLDRGRPLWELWVVEGLEGDRVALVTKTHNSMVDGAGAADVMSVLLSPGPAADPGEPPPWRPRPQPRRTALLLDQAWHRLWQPLDLALGLAAALSRPEETLARVDAAVGAVADNLVTALGQPSVLPFNAEIGPLRRVDWVSMPLAEIKAIRKAIGGTVNDVVLACVSGALRRFCLRWSIDPDTVNVRCLIPVSVRGETAEHGSRVTELIASLPVQISDPAERLWAVTGTMGDLKASRQALGGGAMAAVPDWTVPNLLVQGIRLGMQARPYNIEVANVPGPQVPLYFLGAQLREAYPVAPLLHHIALVVALFSYDGRLFWGLTGDREVVRDLHEFAADLQAAFAELREYAAKSAAKQQPQRPAGTPAAP